MAANDPKPTPARDLGQPLPSTPADLERRSKVDAEAIDAGRRLWHEAAPRGWQGLIEAKAESGR